MNNTRRKTIVKVRSYLSWRLYMGLLMLTLYYYRQYWYLIVMMMAAISAIFFANSNCTLLTVDGRRICFMPGTENELSIDEDQLVSFSYRGENNSMIDIVYREKPGTNREYVLREPNTIRVHQVLNRYYPEKNKSRNEYNEKVAEARTANRQYLEKLKNRIFRK